MKHPRFNLARTALSPRVLVSLAATLALALPAVAQDAGTPAAPPQGTEQYGYSIRQSYDLGGHIAEYSGSRAMYATLVNLHSGPRILNQSLEMHALENTKHFLFDTLTTSSSGYGGDPNNFTLLRMSKGRAYQLNGIFRRDRQYFDYDLFANPLVPAGLVSNGYTFPQVADSPHLFNTVRRMTDVDLTLFPLSKFSFHAGYSQNVMEGPTFGSYHQGIEALLIQGWRNSTDTWRVGASWKALPRTNLTFDEIIEHYKGNTNWNLTGLNLQLSNSTPVSLGYDNVTVPSCANKLAPITASATTPPTANATCNGYLQYSRSAPIRTIFPTEEFRFQSSGIHNVQMNGRFRYTGANSTMPAYNEYFNGFESRTGNRVITTTGNARAQRVNVSTDFGAVWQFAKRLSLSEQFDFWNFRVPGINDLTATAYKGTSMLLSPSATGTATITADNWFLGQKTTTNTVMLRWQASARASLSLGYRYHSRHIVRRAPDTDDILIHQHGGILGLDLEPVHGWKINGNVEIGSADNAYIQLDPRQFQHYQVRTTYRPRSWANLSAAFDDMESRDNVAFVHHLDHDRSFAGTLDITPNAHYGLELTYGYLDFLTQTDECYTITPAPANAILSPSPDCVANGTKYYSNGYYDSPTQYGSFGLTFSPVTRLNTGVGYRMTAVNGMTTFINPRQVPGSLQSQFQTPYANATWTVHAGWGFRGEWNYYGYGEGTPIGPTLPRSFRGNVYTIAMHYEF